MPEYNPPSTDSINFGFDSTYTAGSVDSLDFEFGSLTATDGGTVTTVSGDTLTASDIGATDDPIDFVNFSFNDTYTSPSLDAINFEFEEQKTIVTDEPTVVTLQGSTLTTDGDATSTNTPILGVISGTSTQPTDTSLSTDGSVVTSIGVLSTQSTDISAGVDVPTLSSISGTSTQSVDSSLSTPGLNLAPVTATSSQVTGSSVSNDDPSLITVGGTTISTPVSQGASDSSAVTPISISVLTTESVAQASDISDQTTITATSEQVSSVSQSVDSSTVTTISGDVLTASDIGATDDPIDFVDFSFNDIYTPPSLDSVNFEFERQQTIVTDDSSTATIQGSILTPDPQTTVISDPSPSPVVATTPQVAGTSIVTGDATSTTIISTISQVAGSSSAGDGPSRSTISVSPSTTTVSRGATDSPTLTPVSATSLQINVASDIVDTPTLSVGTVTTQQTTELSIVGVSAARITGMVSAISSGGVASATDSTQHPAITVATKQSAEIRGAIDFPLLGDITSSSLGSTDSITILPSRVSTSANTLTSVAGRDIIESGSIGNILSNTLSADSISLSHESGQVKQTSASTTQADGTSSAGTDGIIEPVVSPIGATSGVVISSALSLVDTASAQTSTLATGPLTIAGDVPDLVDVVDTQPTISDAALSLDEGVTDLLINTLLVHGEGAAIDDNNATTLTATPEIGVGTASTKDGGTTPLVGSSIASTNAGISVVGDNTLGSVSVHGADDTSIGEPGESIIPATTETLDPPGNINPRVSLAYPSVDTYQTDSTSSTAIDDAHRSMSISSLTTDGYSYSDGGGILANLSGLPISSTANASAETGGMLPLSMTAKATDSFGLGRDSGERKSIITSILSDGYGITGDQPIVQPITIDTLVGRRFLNDDGTVTFISSDILLLTEQQVKRGGLVRHSLTSAQVSTTSGVPYTIDAGVSPRGLSTIGVNYATSVTPTLLAEPLQESSNETELLQSSINDVRKIQLDE